MAAVADTSPLLAFAALDLLHLLPELFERVLIPPAVFTEATQNRPEAPGAAAIRRAAALGLLDVRAQPADAADDPALETLGPGEREAIALALSEQAEWLVLDDRRARRVAAGLGIPVIGTVRVLETARDFSYIDAAAPLLERLRAAGFRLSDDIVEAVRAAEHGARP